MDIVLVTDVERRIGEDEIDRARLNLLEQFNTITLIKLVGRKRLTVRCYVSHGIRTITFGINFGQQFSIWNGIK